MAVGEERDVISGFTGQRNGTQSTPLLSRITDDEFENIYWPKLENSIYLILEKDAHETAKLSFEELYRTVYKCVCYNYSETLHSRLTDIVVRHLEIVKLQLKENLPVKIFLERFHLVLLQFHQALAGICAVFNYMNCLYSVGNKSLRTHLIEIFWKTVARNINIVDVIQVASEKPFAVDPEILRSIVTGLYALNPDIAQENIALFAKYIPNVYPRAKPEDLPSMLEGESQMSDGDIRRDGLTRNAGYKRKYDEISTENNNEETNWR